MTTRAWQIGIVGTFDVENYGDLLFPLIVLLVPVRMQTATMLALMAAGPLIRWLAARWLASAGAPPDAMAFAIWKRWPRCY